MLAIVVATFVLAYAAIVLEHPLRLDKTVPALLAGVLCWVFIAVADLGVVNEVHQVGDLKEVLMHHLSEIAQILIFLMGAMVIVELVDLHQGFSVITNRIKTTRKPVLLWIVSVMAFFLSSVLDNLTTTIVFVSLLRRLIPDREERIWYVSFVVIAANAGGAWTPIGDVTTTMLWIKEKVSTLGLIEHLVVPSVLCIVVPCLLAALLPVFRGNIHVTDEQHQKELLSSKTMLALGVGGLIFVPVFKGITGLPPYMGMMLSLAVVWLVSEYIRPTRDFVESDRPKYSVRHALSRIELSSILFFLGILLAIPLTCLGIAY
ncbi:MAG: sodium:proton antiporter NhaD, partial [Bacteroidota bacterium]